MEEWLNPPPESGVGDGAATDPPTLKALAAERDKLQADKDELRDRLMRKQAEFENFRRRSAREKEEVVQFAAMETVRALLPVLDDFERALKRRRPATIIVRGSN